MRAKMTGATFRRMREALGFKKREHIAERIGVTKYAVEKWENGQNPVPKYAENEIKKLWDKV